MHYITHLRPSYLGLNNFTDQVIGFGFQIQFRISASARLGNLSQVSFFIAQGLDAGASDRLPGAQYFHPVACPAFIANLHKGATVIMCGKNFTDEQMGFCTYVKIVIGYCLLGIIKVKPVQNPRRSILFSSTSHSACTA